jgi:hypothetical protein
MLFKIFVVNEIFGNNENFWISLHAVLFSVAEYDASVVYCLSGSEEWISKTKCSRFIGFVRMLKYCPYSTQRMQSVLLVCLRWDKPFRELLWFFVCCHECQCV